MGNVVSEKAPLCCCGPCCPGKLCDSWTWNPTELRWMGNLYCKLSDECGVFDGGGVLEPAFSMTSPYFWEGQMNDERQTIIWLFCDINSGRAGWRQYCLDFIDPTVHALCGYDFRTCYPASGSCSPLKLVFKAHWYDEHTDPEDVCEFSSCEVGQELTITITCQPQE